MAEWPGWTFDRPADHGFGDEFVAIVIGLVVSVATILTGFVDYLRIAGGAHYGNTATIH